MATARLTREFGAVLKARRLKSGLSQEALAHKARTQQGYISLIERGKRSPSLVTISLLAKALGISMTALIREVEQAAE